MLATERQQRILALLEENGTVRTMDLAENFQVTDETIRRDLQALSELYPITRVHGGASSSSGRPKLRSFTERSTVRVAEKQAIARAALEMIEPGKTYAFDSSTTVHALVMQLPDIPLRVLTNAYAVLGQLIDRDHVELISTGGRYHPKTQTFIGSESIGTLRRHHIQTAFISCVGLDPERGASESFEEQALFKEQLVQLASSVCILADSSKLDQVSEYFFAETCTLHRIITDAGADPEVVSRFRLQGIDVVLAPLPSDPLII